MSTATASLEIAFEAPGEVRDALASMGRTEDVRFSPNGRRLAFACYAKEQIAVAEVEITISAAGQEIAVTSVEEYTSPALREPHGLDFVDDDRLIVGNRGGGVSVFQLPPSGATGELTPIGPSDNGRGHLLGAPGSVAVHSLVSGRHEVLACDNWANTVTRHWLDSSGVLAGGQVVARSRLDLPDGIALSDNGRWLAVSNHNSHAIVIYDYAHLDQNADPVGILRGARYPHGLRFGTGDRHLLVADAGAPNLHIYVRSSSEWQGVGYPEATIRVMDDDTFARGHRNPKEGGPKGIDVDPRTNVLVVTAECLPLAFFDVDAALSRVDLVDADALVRYELHVLEQGERIKAEAHLWEVESGRWRTENDLTAAAAAEARRQLTTLQQTKTWRLTQPARRAYGAVLGRKPRSESSNASDRDASLVQ